ncbi:diguanylate cyclase (GGDEF)-like protein [Paraburkholderia sp. BL23I1N1]|nr:diguanylate cyclase (GGDEF)-like protein [Paraburkholderia sp. BL23I1N1]
MWRCARVQGVPLQTIARLYSDPESSPQAATAEFLERYLRDMRDELVRLAMISVSPALADHLREAVERTERALQELQRTNEKLEHMAATDPLTGVANRRQFIQSVEAEIARAKRHGAPFSLLALDLDHFKSINDSYGHQAGDQVLQRFVRKCMEAIRPYDGVARVGGEEFMVLLPQAALDTARTIGERLRASVAGEPFDTGTSGSVAVTVSVGVSEFGRDGQTIDALLRTADERLYRAKHQGRNCVVAA